MVEGGSALIGDAQERRDTIYADHVNMVKFSDPADDGYVKILQKGLISVSGGFGGMPC